MSHHPLLPQAAALLLLSACAAGETSTPSPSTAAPVSPSAPAGLEFADQFDRYNDSAEEHDFVIAEAEENGRPCYQLTNNQYGVTITVPPREGDTVPTATLTCEAGTLDFAMPIFLLGSGTVSGTASLYLNDLTGGGTPELIYIYGSGGTGTWQDEVQIFDLSLPAECPVELDTTELERCASGVTFGSHQSFALTDGELIFTSLFLATEDLTCANYLGRVTAPLDYDPAAGSFALNAPFSVEWFNEEADSTP